MWNSGRVLADVVAHAPLAGLRVLEVGCGLGAVSLAAAAAGADVLATDRSEEAVALVAASAARNGLRVEVTPLEWSRPGDLPAEGPWDLVLGADVLYDEGAASALLRLLPAIVAPAGSAWLADPGRTAAGAFLAAAALDFHVTGLPGPSPVVVHRLRPRG